MFKKFLPRTLFDTDFPRCRNIGVTLVLLSCSGGMVSVLWYFYFAADGTHCYKGFIYMSALWLAIELIVIGYLYKFKNIPKFARDAIMFMIIFSNLWLGFIVVYIGQGGCT